MRIPPEILNPDRLRRLRRQLAKLFRRPGSFGDDELNGGVRVPRPVKPPRRSAAAVAELD